MSGRANLPFAFGIPSRVLRPPRSLGCHEVFLNGQKLGPSVLEPGFSTVPSTRLLYVTHDVGQLLRRGERNVVGVRLGSCKYGWMHTYCAAGPAKCLGVKLQMLNAQGARVFGTDLSAWKGTASPFAPDGAAYPLRALWDGVRYNLSLEQPGWADPATQPAKRGSVVGASACAGWAAAHEVVPPIEPKFYSPRQIPPILKHPPQGLAPRAVWSPTPGVWVADFGSNIAGYATISPGPQNLGAETVFRPRKRTSPFFLL